MSHKLLQQLEALGQVHIIEHFKAASEPEQHAFIEQVDRLNASYPGGLEAYIQRGRKLLSESKEGVNPYEGLIPSVPKGVTLDFNDMDKIMHYETVGEKEMKKCGFVLVAGGLGERLGYQGIKVEIPMDTTTETRFLQYYISWILSIQQKLGDGGKLPFAIMTSDDTHVLTEALLKSNDYFGLDPAQLTIMKQEKVPTLLDSNARLSLEKGKLMIETKPHGHGDVHTLLYSHHLTERWQKEYNTKWVVFFQDTNPLMFRTIIATIGVSKELDLEMNTIGIKILPGEACGAITKLTDKTGKELVINVEYNQLSALAKDLQGPTTDKDGYFILPGNTNGLIFDLEKYHKVLEKTKGTISEFINPKYTDSTKTAFKSSTRLECMMQDYPKLLDNCTNVGFTTIDRKLAYAPCKNDVKSAGEKFKQGLPAESASTCQASIYECNRTLLRLCGAQIQDHPGYEYHGIKTSIFPRVFLSPKFALTLKEMRTKVKSLKISEHSTLVVLSDCVLDDVEVDGTLKIEKEGHITVHETSKNYTRLIPTEGHEPGWQLIRGYKVGPL